MAALDLDAMIRRNVRADLRRSIGYDDLLQEARLVVLAAVKGCRHESHAAYAAFCVRRRLRYLCRRELRRVRPAALAIDVEGRDRPPAEYPDTAGLSWPQRLTLTLMGREGLTATECATALGVTHQAVYHRLGRVREKLTSPPE